MISISGLLKNSLKKILGKDVYFHLSQIHSTLNYCHLKDVIALRYHFIRLKNKAETLTRTKPHILFVTEKWCDGNPSRGLTNSEHNLFSSLEGSGLATQDRIHPDEYWLQRNKRSFDTALLLKCIKSNPDLLILTWPSTPKVKTLKLIKKRLQIPMVALWWDSVNHMEEAELFLPFVEFNVLIDSAAAHIGKTHEPEKYLPMWAPQDTRVFHNPDLHRPIDVSFMGTMTGHPDRVAGISALRSNAIDVYQTGGQREHRLPVDEYARTYMRTKIALNFCYHPNGKAQLKGRVFEATLCGAMLLEAENIETARWFEPMVDYVPFTDAADLVEQVRYYLAHGSERSEIAARGHHKAKERYTGEMFWKTVFKKVFGTDF